MQNVGENTAVLVETPSEVAVNDHGKNIDFHMPQMLNNPKLKLWLAVARETLSGALSMRPSLGDTGSADGTQKVPAGMAKHYALEERNQAGVVCDDQVAADPQTEGIVSAQKEGLLKPGIPILAQLQTVMVSMDGIVRCAILPKEVLYNA